MGEVIPQAEIAYTKHLQDKGTASLIAWYRAELVLLDEDRRTLYGAHTDEHLEKHQNHAEALAGIWRNKRRTVVLSNASAA